MKLFEKKDVEEIEEVIEAEIVDENTEEETEDMKPKKNRRKYLKWIGIGLGTAIGGTIAILAAKKNHDDAEAAIWLDSMSGDEEDETDEDDAPDENTEDTAE